MDLNDTPDYLSEPPHSEAQTKAEALDYDISVFEMFSIGIGPSSSHTVGPMRATNRFIAELIDAGSLNDVTRVHIDLYGSLAATGAGHGTMSAAIKGLAGFVPETIDIAAAEALMDRNQVDGTLPLAGYPSAAFESGAPGPEATKVSGPVLTYKEADITLRPLTVLPRHTNGIKVTAYAGESVLLERTYFSIGGGFIVEEHEESSGSTGLSKAPYPFGSGEELLDMANSAGLSIAQLKMENEKTERSESEVRAGILHIRQVMKECIGSSLERIG